MLSNKTYFLEEVSKHKLIAKEAKRELTIYKEKLQYFQTVESKNIELTMKIDDLKKQLNNEKFAKDDIEPKSPHSPKSPSLK